MCAAVPLKSGDEGNDDDESARTRSKYKSEKPSKKRKSSTSEKKKSHSPSEPSPKKAKGAVTEDKVRFFRRSVILSIHKHLDFNPTYFHSLALHLKLTT